MVFACPKCGGMSFDLFGDAPEHGVFYYSCTACLAIFQPVDPPRPPMRVEPPPPPRPRAETREERQAFLERFAERLAKMTP
jgi:hypothetical protein